MRHDKGRLWDTGPIIRSGQGSVGRAVFASAVANRAHAVRPYVGASGACTSRRPVIPRSTFHFSLRCPRVIQLPTRCV